VALELRRSTEEELPAVRELLALALGNRDADDPVEEMFAWKHQQNAFGRSPSWVAVDSGRVVAFRTFMRWRFRWSGRPVSAVRAVDTATHPDYRGQGLFRSLTMQAVEELTEEGVGFVFNTPNDQSRPGYLSMGWKVVGNLPISARPRGPVGLSRMARARQPAALWSEPRSFGMSCADWLDSRPQLASLLPPVSASSIVTDRDEAYLRWRYGFEPLGYRVATSGAAASVFRVRRRGPARELALEEKFDGGVPIARLLRGVGADYAVGLGISRPRGGLPLPGNGPLLTWRALAETEMPPLAAWDLALGDVELF
jgi:GNAT superfamily N-acetyltransferase